MPRRIEIEITSVTGQLATWRAAGAKLPKGVLDTSLIPEGPVVGKVYRADIEQYMEGIEILSVLPAKTASPLDPKHERVELLPVAKQGPDVIVTYAPKGRGARRDSHEGDARPPRTKRPAGRPAGKDRPSSVDRPDRGAPSENGERSERPRPTRTPRGEGAHPPPQRGRSSTSTRSQRTSGTNRSPVGAADDDDLPKCPARDVVARAITRRRTVVARRDACGTKCCR